MENVKIISDNGIETTVNGIFYVFNSKYYFIYTNLEKDENNYVQLYVVQVCKEIKNTPTGPIDTGYMIGLEITNPEEWQNVQSSITKIVDDKKNKTQNSAIQYLPMSMLTNLKIISKNKFKLMKHIVENDFNVSFMEIEKIDASESSHTLDSNIQTQNINNTMNNVSENSNVGEVIIDYRARFFEEQEKNQNLEEQIKILNEKLENVKNIIG